MKIETVVKKLMRIIRDNDGSKVKYVWDRSDLIQNMDDSTAMCMYFRKNFRGLPRSVQLEQYSNLL